MDSDKSFAQKCAELLDRRWNFLSKKLESEAFVEPLSEEHSRIKRLIVESLTGRIKSYHYVLPTQLLAKCVDPKLDCHSLQTAYNKRGSFDARTIAHGVLVPFDQSNHRVLGGSAEPYVNNPLRYPVKSV